MTDETNGETIPHSIIFLAKVIFGLGLILIEKEILNDKDMEKLAKILEE